MTIALVTRLDRAADVVWCERLNPLLPNETIVPFSDIPEHDRHKVDLAIVANPAPTDVASLPNLKWVHSLWAGVERLVTELPDLSAPLVRLVDPELSRTMAEASLAWIYYLFRDMPTYARQQRLHIWKPLDYRKPETVTVGILGLGTLGQAAAARLTEAEFRVAGWSRSEKHIPNVLCHSGDDGLNDLLAQSDIVLCLLPLTPQTRGLVNGDRLSAMRAGSSIINFARGPVIDTPALVAALNTGHIAHAILDVFDVEPLPDASPLWDHPSVTVLPHISAPTDPDTAAAIVAANIRRYRETGQIPPTVDFGRGY